MARPEKPITAQDPVADLARALREVRVRAGSPPYRDLAGKALHSASVLADAASGGHCPTWKVTESFARACCAEPDTLRPLWEAANEHHQALRRAARPRPRTKLATVRRLPRRSATEDLADPKNVDPRVARGPDPWSARTPAEYVHLLRALRAWGGNPGIHEVWPGSQFWSVSRSGFYVALHPSRTILPPLRIVQPLVRACGADVEEWVAAWRALSLREFDKANPPPVLPGQLADQDVTVHTLERPAR
jgi:hypothetical protein